MRAMIIDLHSHTTISDGTLTPSELLAHAAKQEVDVLALTDHDNVDGLEEAAEAAKRLGIRLINGVEISTMWKGQTIHVVALNVDPTYQPLRDGLQKICEYRGWRAEEIGRRLAKKRIEGAYEGAKAFAKGSLIARPHFGRFLIAEGYCKDMREVFKKYLVRGRPGYVPGKWAELEDAVNWILGAGGIPIIAHPARYRLTAGRLRTLFAEFKELGGLGIEVVSSSHSPDECNTMAAHAIRAGLLASQGSDYHGPENKWVELGRLHAMPEGCDVVWESEYWPAEPSV
ncbi:MAG: PHP domain-containing protein [Sulfuriflexus sp.]|nr:PHP domain-containing protein [Sulfuriflexus sp.]